jgi:hypothetical protein
MSIIRSAALGSGAGSVTTSGDPIPQVGDCPANLGSGPITDGQVVSETDNVTLSVSDGSLAPAPTAVDGANVWRDGVSVY